MLLKKFRSRIIQCFLVSMTLFLFIIFLVCSSDKYPESYGVYLCENLNPIKKIEYREPMFFNIDLEQLPLSENKSSISLWFYDPKIVPTELKFGRVNYYTNEIENFDFNTKPIDGKSGLFKIEITQPVEEGIYALYSYNLIKRSTVPALLWPFLIANKKNESSFKEEILGKWQVTSNEFWEFMQNGDILLGNEQINRKIGNYKFISSDSLQIEFTNGVKIKRKGKIYFISDKLLYYELLYDSGDKINWLLSRQN